jgi:hypothetical protein
MSERQHMAESNGQLAVLVRDVRVRVLNCSASGCLLETSARMDVGATASLHMTIDGEEFVDGVQVVRCQLVEGAGALYQVAVRFLWNTPPDRRALRHGIWQLCQRASES